MSVRTAPSWSARALRTAVTLALLGTALAVGSPASAAQPVDEVHYSFTSGTSVAIDWRGDADDVRWGATTDYGTTAHGTAPAWTPWSSAGPFWQLELTGLAPGATYHYSVGGGPDRTFHSPPTSAFRFDAIGDVGDTTSFSKLGDTMSAIAGDDPSFVLMVGDLTYANANGASMSVVDQHFNDVMASWGSSAAYIPAWGNHEYDVAGSDDLRNYKGRLLMPHAQASPGSPAISCCGDDWGWFDAGPVRFISYPEPWTGAWADWQSKANTLIDQAQSDPSVKYVVTYGHRPAYSTGYHPGEAQLATILDGFGASYSKYVLNINGHSHDYERFQPIQGVTHVTVGAPSSLEGPWTSTDARTAFRAMHLSHLRVDVSDTGIRLQAVCDASSSKETTSCMQGSVLDEYTIGTPPATAPKTQYYTDRTVPTCSDTGPGTAATPFCTVTRGISRLQPGYTLYIGDGSYAETIKPLVSGTAGSPVTVTAWPGRSPVIGPGITNGAYVSARSYVTLSNLTFTGTTGDGIYVTKSDHITVTGNRVTGSGVPLQSQTAPGISLRATNGSTVSGNVSDRNNGHGIYVTNTSTGNTIADNEASQNAEGWQRNANGIDVISPGNVVLRNVTHDNEDSGIQFYTGGNDNLAVLNVSYDNGDHGIDDLNVTGGRIIGNTVYRNCTTGINVEGTSGSYTVVNNIAVDNAVYPAYKGIACNRRKGNIGIWDSAPPTTVVDHNLVRLSAAGTLYVFGSSYTTLAAMQAATGQEVHGIQADPRFADPASWDLQLVEGSPAIDRGDSGVSGEQDRDILGHLRVRDPAVSNAYATGPRLYDDLGAYEFQPDVAPAPTGPTARLTVTPTSGTAPVTVTADASASSDPQGGSLTYTFDFGDGSAPVTGGTATASHDYAVGGSYPVKVTVTDSTGLVDAATVPVSVATAPSAPSAALTVTPSTGTAPVTVTADASASSDPQGQALTYTFDFGDGNTPITGSTATASHDYGTAGTYQVAVTVTDTSGLSGQALATVQVSAPLLAPTASLTVTPSSGTAPVDVTADASASTDPQGQALAYTFDFGDGSPPVTQNAPSAGHTYATAGTYQVTVTVTDTAGLTDGSTVPVTVTAAPAAPTAALTVTPSAGTAPATVSADGSASTDPQGQALAYTFDFGDGSAPVTGASATAQHSYPAAGHFTVTLTVTDQAGLTGSSTATVVVDPAPQPPVADLTVSPASGTAPVTVTADASASTDPQGQALTYTFDFGDGSGPVSGTSAVAAHTYLTAGSWTVTLTVTSTTGLTSTATRSVSVAAPPSPPTARLAVTPSSGTAPVAVTADASASTDPQGQALTYTFDFGDGSAPVTQGTATAGHTYTAAGSWTVTVTVTDTAGLSSSTTGSVQVAAAPAYLGQVGSATSTTAATTARVTLTKPVPAGDVILLAVQTSRSATRPVTAADGAATVYAVATSLADSTGAKLSVLSGRTTKALAAGATITVTLPVSSTFRITADQLTGVTTPDRTAIASGRTTAFSSGASRATTVAPEVAVGLVALTGSSTAPVWGTGWTAGATLTGGTSLVARAGRQLTTTGTVTASGTATGTWTAAVVAFRP